jgi:N-acetylglutamate synthase-like GNAT family acetyltransferase
MGRSSRSLGADVDASVTDERRSISDLLSIRAYSVTDEPQVRELLEDLPDLYPHGDKWLDRTFGEIGQGKARLTVVEIGTDMVAVSIEKPKDHGRMKLSTLYIHPDFRNMRVGTSFFSYLNARWQSENWKEVYMTVASQGAYELERLVKVFRFACVAVQEDRYGLGRDEVVFSNASGS